MATQKLNIYYVLGEAKEIAKSHFGHFSPFSLLFIIPLSLLIVLYPTLQHSLSPTQSDSYLPFPYSGDPIVFKPLSLFLLYLFTLLCLFICAAGTVSYAVYHGYLGQPVKFIDAFKSLSKSLMRLLATFFCSQLIALAGLVVIGLIVFGVTRGIEYLLGYETPYDSVYFRVLCVIVLGPLVYSFLNADWVLAAVIVVVESSWGLKPLRRSAYLVKGYRLLGFRLLFSACVMPWLITVGFGSWGSFTPFGSSVYQSTLVAVNIAFGTAILSGYLLHMLIANTIFYMKCKALQGEDKVPDEVIAQDINREYTRLPLDEEKVVDLV